MEKRTLIMGILNVTPDSFSDGGAFVEVSEAVKRARQLVREGADWIDIGGESTRPDATPVSEEEEMRRVIPVIREVRRALPEIPISIDTFKANVAAAAIEAGADSINDVWGLKAGFEEELLQNWSQAAANGEPLNLPISPMAAVAAKLKCDVFLMHNRPTRKYADFWTEIIADLRVSLVLAEAAGIEKNRIWLDPGFGFAKGPAHTLAVLRQLGGIGALGYAVLLGTSRKSTLGRVLGRPADQRHEGTAATTVWGIAKGCQMVRVHDVAEIVPYVRMADAIGQGAAFDEKAQRK